jgi:hypothetical protein
MMQCVERCCQGRWRGAMLIDEMPCTTVDETMGVPTSDCTQIIVVAPSCPEKAETELSRTPGRTGTACTATGLVAAERSQGQLGQHLQ